MDPIGTQLVYIPNFGATGMLQRNIKLQKLWIFKYEGGIWRQTSIENVPVTQEVPKTTRQHTVQKINQECLDYKMTNKSDNCYSLDKEKHAQTVSYNKNQLHVLYNGSYR